MANNLYTGVHACMQVHTHTRHIYTTHCTYMHTHLKVIFINVKKWKLHSQPLVAHCVVKSILQKQCEGERFILTHTQGQDLPLPGSDGSRNKGSWSRDIFSDGCCSTCCVLLFGWEDAAHRVGCSETCVFGDSRPCHIDSVSHHSHLGNCVRRPFTGAFSRLHIEL